MYLLIKNEELFNELIESTNNLDNHTFLNVKHHPGLSAISRHPKEGDSLYPKHTIHRWDKHLNEQQSYMQARLLQIEEIIHTMAEEFQELAMKEKERVSTEVIFLSNRVKRNDENGGGDDDT